MAILQNGKLGLFVLFKAEARRQKFRLGSIGFVFATSAVRPETLVLRLKRLMDVFLL